MLGCRHIGEKTNMKQMYLIIINFLLALLPVVTTTSVLNSTSQVAPIPTVEVMKVDEMSLIYRKSYLITYKFSEYHNENIAKMSMQAMFAGAEKIEFKNQNYYGYVAQYNTGDTFAVLYKEETSELVSFKIIGSYGKVDIKVFESFLIRFTEGFNEKNLVT